MSILSELQHTFPNIAWETDVSLAPFTYMKVGGPAEVFWRALERESLERVVQWLKHEHPEVPLTILGGASNVVIADEGIAGVVIVNACSEVHVASDDELREIAHSCPTCLLENDKKIFFLAESGIKTALLVRASIDAGLAGLEPFLGVPGTLGGAVYNNAHYTTELIGTSIVAVRVVDDQGVHWLSQDKCEFAYDASRFQKTGEIITQVLFALEPGNAEKSQEILRETTQKRAATQPLGTANSGCMFKNAELSAQQQQEYDGKRTLSAGWLIDQAGMKGARVGGAVVSSKHANFLINENNATAEDVNALARMIEQTVLEKFGIHLQREVFFIGKWRK